MGNIIDSAKVTERTGVVTSIDPEKATVKVEYEDLVDASGKPVISNDIQVVFRRAYGDREYWMPEIGEQVKIGHDGRGIETAYSVGGVYSKKDPPPVTDPHKHHIQYKDGSIREYDRKEHKLTIRISGKALQDEGENGQQSRTRDTTASGEGEGGGDGEKGGKIDVYAEETIYIFAKGNITIKTEADILVEADGKIDVIAKKDINVKSDAKVTVEAKDDVTVKTDANVTITAAKDIKAKADGNIDLDAQDIKINASGNIDMTAGGTATIKGSTVNIN